MSEPVPHEQLIAQLSAGLRPVQPLPNPWRRTLLWLMPAFWGALLFAEFADMDAFRHRMMAAPDMWLAFVGAVLTGVLAAAAALATSVPDRSARWAWLPVPAFLLWVGASIAGCLRRGVLPFTQPEPMMHGIACIYVIVLVAVPLSMLLMVQLIRACPLRPRLTSALGGLASAGASAALLALVHPFDANAADLIAHAVAVVVVIGGNELVGARLARG